MFAEVINPFSPTAWLNWFLIHFTYVALVLVLVIASCGLPLPEDIPLITGGYLCSPHGAIAKANLEDLDNDGKPDHRRRQVPDLYLMMLAGMIGVLAGDSIVFSIGRRGIKSNNVVSRHLRKVMHSRRREKVERHFAKHGNLTVFAGRFLPGARSLIFAFAGLSRMSYVRFVLIDGLAAAISVPTFVYLGYHFASRLNVLFDFIASVKHIIIPCVLVLLAGAGLLYYLRRRRVMGAPTPPLMP
ncbi:MAG TPA: DedA family protein [Phycisphaerae bacterium]|nr:DedA family protein [Phycisphaerae bacterium]